MGLTVLFNDELKGFAKSRVMIFLWIGMPLLTLLFHLLTPFSQAGAEQIPATLIAAMMVSSVGGTLASVMLVVSIIHEKSKNVFELFLIKPIKRRDIIYAKFFAVYFCVAIAGILALSIGVLIDISGSGSLSGEMLRDALESILVSLSMMAISCSAAVLIGVASSSVLVGVIAIIYGGNQVAGISMVPTLLNIPYKLPITIAIGSLCCIISIWLAIVLFNRQQY